LVVVGEGFAMVDDEDYPILSRHTWHASTQGATTYAHRNVTKNPRAVESMHRMVMGSPAHSWMVIDHIDGCGLNNCKANLRFVSKSGNALNQARHRAYDDVGIRCVDGKWIARIAIERKYRHVGTFETKDEAVAAKKAELTKYFEELK